MLLASHGLLLVLYRLLLILPRLLLVLHRLLLILHRLLLLLVIVAIDFIRFDAFMRNAEHSRIFHPVLDDSARSTPPSSSMFAAAVAE